MTITAAIQNKLGQVINVGDSVVYPRKSYSGNISLVEGIILKIVVKQGARPGQYKSYATVRVKVGSRGDIRCIRRTENLIKY